MAQSLCLRESQHVMRVSGFRDGHRAFFFNTGAASLGLWAAPLRPGFRLRSDSVPALV